MRGQPLLLALAAAWLGAHGATAIWDVRTAVDGGREVRQAEQHIHSFLKSVPFMAVSALCCLHWDQVRRASQFDLGDRQAWRLRPRPKRLPAVHLASAAAGVAALIAAPYAEEL